MFPLSTLSVAFSPLLHPQTFPPRSKTSSPPPVPQMFLLHLNATTTTLPQTLLLHPHASASPLLPLRSNPPLCSNHSHVSNKHTITHSEGNVLTSLCTQTNKTTSLPSDPHRSTKTRTFPTVELQHRTHTPGVILGNGDRHSEGILERTRLAAVGAGVLDLSEPERQFRLLVATVAEIVRKDGHLSRESTPPHLRNCACTSDAPFRS